jgi:hypothetical protein
MKVAMTFFVIFILLGLLSSIALYHQQFDFSTETASNYYRGNQGEKNVDTFYVPKPYPRLLEVTHFHLYITSLVYLAFTHLYFLSPRSTAEKVGVTVVVFTGLLTEIATPWLVRYGSGSFSLLFWFSGLAITVTTLWMAFVCLGEMWLGSNE